MKILYQILPISLLPLLAVLSINYYQSEHIKQIHKTNTINSFITIEKNISELLNKKTRTYKQFSHLIVTSSNIQNAIKTRDNNVLYTTAKKYIDSKLFTKILFIDNKGFVIARGENEYLFNDNIKNTLLKDIFNKKEELSAIVEFDGKYNLIYLKPIYRFDVEFAGYILIGETIDSNFLETLNINNYFLKFDFKNDKTIDNFNSLYSINKDQYENYTFTLKYKQLTKSDTSPIITIYKNYKNEDKLFENNSINLSNFIILMLFILPIIIWYLTKKILSPINNLNKTLANFMDNKISLDKTIKQLKNVPSSNIEIEQIIKSVLSSLTKLYNTQHKLITEKEKTQKADQYKSEFISNISTQIDQPLNTILTFGDILQQTNLDKEQKNYLNPIVKNSYKLKNIFSDLIDLSNIAYENLKLDIAPIDIEMTFDDIEKFFKVEIENKGLEFEIYIDPLQSDLCLYLDKERFKQVVSKFIENSLEYTSSGYIKISFTIDHLDTDSSELDFTVNISDSGKGIDKENKLRIQNSFENSHIYYDKKYGSIGLDLSLANKLIKLMNGNIILSSEVGKGTTFSLSFNKIRFNKDKPCSNNETSKEKRSIIVADTDIQNNDIIKEYLCKNSQDINIIQTDNGYDTVKYCFNSQCEIPLIIINDNIRSMKIKELLDYLRSNDHTKNIKLLIIKDELSVIEEADHIKTINKPIDLKKLSKSLKKLDMIINPN